MSHGNIYAVFGGGQFAAFGSTAAKSSLGSRSYQCKDTALEGAMLGKYSRRLWICVMLLALLPPTAGVTDDRHPLEPQDLSSPRATLNTFLTTGDVFSQLLRDEYWHAPSRAVVDRITYFEAELERTLDLSDIPPAARFELGRDGVHYLYDVLSRIEIPPELDIPDAAVYANIGPEKEGGYKKTVSWTIPHTEIHLVRIADGPRAGEFIFSSSTVTRAKEFFEKSRALPYRRDVPLKNYADMRPYLTMHGWMISSRTIEGFPGWLKRSVYEQAVWKWIALAILITMTAIIIVIFHRLARRGLSGRSAGAHLRRLVTPLTLLLVPLVLNLANRQLSLLGWISGSVTLAAEAITYLALAWITWTVSVIVAEAVIASPRIPDQSLNAHLLRIAARCVGIAGVITIVFYVSNRLGAPLYGLVAGLGVGGLALALAVRPTLENIIGSVTLFADKPVRVGDFCRFGDEYGTVEQIGLRSIRLRKRDDTVISLPNAEFTQRELTNYTRRRRWLYQTTLGLRYETSSEQLRYVMAKLREMLLGHPKVSPDTLHVRFDGFGAYSLDVAVFAYIRTRDWLSYRAIREDINLRIMDIVEEAGTGFAFPSQTAYLGRDVGLDAERSREAEAELKAWRSKGQLPFPEFDEGIREEKEDVLDYPPEGSPNYKPRVDSSDPPPVGYGAKRR
jgi:MscS family membrane protein